jgi:hypothetical protein
VKIGLRVGAERLSRYVGLYGFGKRVSPDFPSENAGIVWSPEKWTESALASVSMGYQVGVTPLQMVAAVSAWPTAASTSSRASSARSTATAALSGDAEGRAPDDQRRHRRGADRRSWKASSTDGTAQGAQIDGYTSPARPARRRS